MITSSIKKPEQSSIATSKFMPEMSLSSLNEKGWTLADSRHHLLGSLQGRHADSYILLVLLGEKNRFGASYFKILLQKKSGEMSQPVLTGLFSRGSYPAYNWIEVISLAPVVRFYSGNENLDIAPGGLSHRLLQLLADLIPLGGHLMIEYDSPAHRETARALAVGVPPAATPLGYLMFLVGCGAGYKDWHFAEGGAEGSRKLQGYKALNRQHAEIKARQMERELNEFLKLSQADGSELKRAARSRAMDVLSRLKQTGLLSG